MRDLREFRWTLVPDETPGLVHMECGREVGGIEPGDHAGIMLDLIDQHTCPDEVNEGDLRVLTSLV